MGLLQDANGSPAGDPHHEVPGGFTDQSSDDDQIVSDEEEDEELSVVIHEIHERTQTTVDRPWAAKVRDSILDGRRGIHNRIAYLRKTIRDEPDPRGRFLPSPHDVPRADTNPLPPWCGTCGLDTDQPEHVVRRNRRWRTIDGQPCPTCHPDTNGEP